MAATYFSLNDYLIIDATGSVGIGSTSPLAKFFVTGSSVITSQPTVIFKAGSAVQSAGTGIFDVQNSTGTSLLFVSGSGNVGIGTSSPATRLHVSGSSTSTATTALLRAGAPSQIGAILDVQDNTGTTVLNVSGSVIDFFQAMKGPNGSATATTYAFQGSAGTGMYRGTGGQLLRFAVSNAYAFGVDTNGNFGINVTATTQPSAVLHVSGSTTTTTPTALFKQGPAAQVSSIVDVQTNLGSTLFNISGSGNVGIGTVSAAQLLHIHSGSLLINTIGTGTNYDIWIGRAGGWGTNETHSLNVYYNGPVVPTVGGSLEFLYDGTKQNINFRNLYNAGASTAIAMTVQGNGNVGIGTSTATVRFQVSGSSTASTPTMIVREGVASPTGGALAFEIENSTGGTILAVTGSGLVGINTASPNAQLAVYNASLPTISLQNSSNYTRLATNANDFYFDVGLGGTAGATVFRRSSGANESMRIDSSGNVGIGTSGMSGLLNVYKTAGGNVEIVSLITTYAADSTYRALTWRDPSNITGQIDTRYNGTTVDMVFGSLYNSGYNSTERMRIKGNGDVGIGTSSFTGRLYISGSSTGTTPTLVARHGIANGSNLPVLDAQNSVGTSLLFVSGSGNVGIGTASPNAALDVNKSNGVPDIRLAHAGTAYMNLYGGSGVGALTLLAVQNEPLVFGTNNTERVRISSTGLVGIGTASPSTRLHVNSTGNEQFWIMGGGAGYLFGGYDQTNSRGRIGAYTGAAYTTLLLNEGGGNVGIGTITPIAKLHVYDTTSSTTLLIESGSLGASVGSGAAYNSSEIASLKYSNGNTSYLKIKGVRHTAVADWTGASTRIQQVIDTTNMAYIDFNPVGGTYGLSFGTGTGPTEAMRIDSSQNVGIGTTTMTRKLVVQGSDALINSLTVGRGSTSADSTNSALGSAANSTVTSGQYNTAVGFYANRQSNGGENTAVGYVAMDGNTASYNTAVGSQALYAVTSGPYNTAVGYKSLYSTGASNYSVGVGAEAGYGGSSAGRTAIGYQALTAAAAAYSTAVGYRALAANTTGTNNVGLGALTLEVNDTGANNTAIGANALAKLSKYDRNTAVGANAMATSTQGQDSVAVGYYALYSTSTDVANTAIGSYALQSATSGYNVGIGYSSLYSVSTGGFNVAIGPQAGTSITTGAGNVVIGGYGAGGAFATQSNNIFISDGSANLRMIITGSNGYVGIGNTQPSSSVTVYNSTTNSTAAVEVQAPPYSGVSLSTAKFSLSIAGTEYGRMQVRYGLTAAAETVLAAVGSGQALAFETNAARAVTVDTSQRVGVGTNAPDTTANTKFHVYNGNAIFNSGYGVNWTGLAGPTNGTRTATTLDHYDYGTWTPVFAGSTTAGTYTLANTKAYYVRVGKLVVVSMYTEVSSVGSAGSGDWRITSLPYSSSSGVGIAAVGKYTGLAANVATISGVVEEGNTYVEMYVTTANGTANAKAAIATYVAAGTKIAMTITYRMT